MQRRRRSDVEDFIQTDVNVEALAEEIFSRYVGEQRVVVEGSVYTATFFRREYCADLRVMKLAGHLALAVNQHAASEQGQVDGIHPLRVKISEVMLAALLHDLGKQHEDCAPFIDLLKQTDLRGDATAEAAARQEYLLGIVRDVHVRKGACMLDRLREAGRSELNSPFVATVARRHGDDYQTNQAESWWSREISVVTIADDYDAMTSQGPERAYKSKNITSDEAAALLRRGAARGRYEPRIAEIFIADVLALGTPPSNPGSR